MFPSANTHARAIRSVVAPCFLTDPLQAIRWLEDIGRFSLEYLATDLQ